MKINGIKVKGEKFAYDDCHKIYIIETKKDEIEAFENDYIILPIEEIERVYNRSCGLRFIHNWKLNKTYVAQFENAVFEYGEEKQQHKQESKKLKKYTIKTHFYEQTFVCYEIDDFLCDVCFCDAYVVIKEENAEYLQPLFDEYLSRIPQEYIDEFSDIDWWKKNVLLLLSGYYETFDEMIEDNK